MKILQTMEVTNKATGKTFYYIDGRRVSRGKFYSERFGHYVDCFITRIKGNYIRHYSSVRVN